MSAAWETIPLAWEYLLPERTMTRRVDTVEFHSARWAMRRMELDVSFPPTCVRAEGDSKRSECLVPFAFLPKEPVASDLEVCDAGGAIVSIPTKSESMVLTERALAEISAGAGDLLGVDPDTHMLDEQLRKRCADVIEAIPLDARVLRKEIVAHKLDGEEDPKRAWLLPLLQRLEDSYLLWVPICGRASSQHHLSLCRSDQSEPDPIFRRWRRRPVDLDIPSAEGIVKGHWSPPSKLRVPDLPEALGRALVTFGLTPVNLEESALEAARFASYHLRLVPPAGLLVREVHAERIPEDQWDVAQPDVVEIKDELELTVQGRDTQTGHVHLSKNRNPSRIRARVTFGIRPGTTTLWALVAVLTCALLLTFHRNFHELFSFLADGEGKSASSKGRHHRHLVDFQIIVAVLLVGPTFAAGWILREKDPALLRSMLAGTRLLLLGSATLAVGTALALAGVTPFGWSRAEAVDWYASASYVIAVVILIGWVQARSLIWAIYRSVLKRAEWNLLASVVLALGSYLAIRKLADFPALSTTALLLGGFGFAAVAGNRAATNLGFANQLAGVAALLTLALASRELLLFNRLLDRRPAHLWGWRVELAIAVIAVVGLVVYLVKAIRSKSTPPRQNSAPEAELAST